LAGYLFLGRNLCLSGVSPILNFFLLELIAKTFAGLEQVLAEEIKNLGGTQITPLRRAVSFVGDLKLLYRANLELRTALRVLMPIHSFRFRSQDEFYEAIKAWEWEANLSLDRTFAIDAVVHSSIFTHSKFAALKAKDAIADRFRDRFRNRRPSVNTNQPDLLINVYISDHEAHVSLDSSGRSLHLRGYRHATVPAPMNEVLAAGVLRITGYTGARTLIDPMCGSGTIPIEAALIATGRPPQRRPETLGFLRWGSVNRELWREVLEEAESRVKPLEAEIWGRDMDMKAFKATQENALAAGIDGLIQTQRGKLEKLDPPPGEPGILIVNPPYDKRLEQADIEAFYARIGDTLKSRYEGYTAWVFSCHLPALKHLGLRTSSKHSLYNGPLECKLHEYELYAGSRTLPFVSL
jgi:putative N6-adenine-specific DNA methylase